MYACQRFFPEQWWQRRSLFLAFKEFEVLLAIGDIRNDTYSYHADMSVPATAWEVVVGNILIIVKVIVIVVRNSSNNSHNGGR